MEISEELAKALGVDVSPEQGVVKIEVVILSGEHPKLIITRQLLRDRLTDAVRGISKHSSILKTNLSKRF